LPEKKEWNRKGYNVTLQVKQEGTYLVSFSNLGIQKGIDVEISSFKQEIFWLGRADLGEKF
jgi:Ribonuclease G/E